MEMPDGPPPSRPPAFHPLAEPPHATVRRPAAAPLTSNGKPVLVPRSSAGRSPAAPVLAVCADPAQAAALLNTWLGQCRRQGRKAAVLWVQLQRTEPTPLTALVPVLGQRLRHRVRATDHMAQVGDDAFMLLLMDADRAAALLVRARLLAALREPCGPLADASAALQPRVGWALAGEHGSTAGPLLRMAALHADA